MEHHDPEAHHTLKKDAGDRFQKHPKPMKRTREISDETFESDGSVDCDQQRCLSAIAAADIHDTHVEKKLRRHPAGTIEELSSLLFAFDDVDTNMEISTFGDESDLKLVLDDMDDAHINKELRRHTASTIEELSSQTTLSLLFPFDYVSENETDQEIYTSGDESDLKQNSVTSSHGIRVSNFLRGLMEDLISRRRKFIRVKGDDNFLVEYERIHNNGASCELSRMAVYDIILATWKNNQRYFSQISWHLRHNKVRKKRNKRDGYVQVEQEDHRFDGVERSKTKYGYGVMVLRNTDC